MIILPKKYSFILLLPIIMASTNCFCQDASVKASIDKNEILIGEQVKVKVDVTFPPGVYSSGITNLPDSLTHFEIVDNGKVDETFADNKLTGITRNFILTSFDSGKWVLPPVKIDLVPSGSSTAVTLYTDSFPVLVSYSVSDTTSQLKDIKPIRGVEIKFPLWYWIAAGVILTALIIFIIWFYKHWKKNRSKPVNTVFKAKLSPFDEATQSLNELAKVNLGSQEEIKIFYTKLTDILRRYLSRKDNILYFNATSGDLLILLKQKGIDRDMLSGAASSLRLSDAVKFAKYIAPVNECKESLQSIKQTISVTEELTLTNKQ